MDNLLSNLGLVDPKIIASDIDLPVPLWASIVHGQRGGIVCKKSKYLLNGLHTFTIVRFMCSMKATKHKNVMTTLAPLACLVQARLSLNQIQFFFFFFSFPYMKLEKEIILGQI